MASALFGPHLLLLLLKALRHALAETHEFRDTSLDALLLALLKGLGTEARHALIEASLHQIIVRVHGLVHLHVVQLRENLMLILLRHALHASHQILRWSSHGAAYVSERAGRAVVQNARM